MSKKRYGEEPPSKNWDSLGGAFGGFYYFNEDGECRLYDVHPAAEWKLLDEIDHNILRLLSKTPGLTGELIAGLFEGSRESASRRLSALRKGGWLLAGKKGLLGYHVSEKAKVAMHFQPPPTASL